MATKYPANKDDNSSLPSNVNGSTDTTASVPHDANHNNANDAIKALETKLGTGSSTPTTAGQVLTVTSSGVTAWSTIPTQTATGTAGGDLSGSYPNPTVSKVNGQSLAAVAFSGSWSDIINKPTINGTNTGDQQLSISGSTLSISGGNGNSVTLPAGGGTGTVTNFSASGTQGVTTSVSNATTTPALTIGLGNITPTSVAATGTVSGSNLSGTNTGDQTITLTGDVTGAGTGSFATTLATSGVTAGSYTNANITVDAKGRITAAANGTGGGSGSSTLAGDTDVSITSPVNKDVLTYDSTAGKWTNQPVGTTTVPDATTTSKGIVQLAGDLGGTAAAPTVPGLANKVSTTTTVNGHALSANVTVTANDVLPTQTGNSGKYLTTDGTNSSWATVTGGGTGNVTGPATSTNTAIARYSGTSGTLIEDSTVTVSDTGDISGHSFSGQSVSAGTIKATGSTLGQGLYVDKMYSNSGSTIDVSSVRLTSLADPTGAQDAATKNYVDTHAGSGSVSGPASSTAGDIATFSDTTGKVIQDSGKTLPTGNILGDSDTQTLTNKTLTAPIISASVLQANDFQGKLVYSTANSTLMFSDGTNNHSLTTNDSTQTLTNKTLTAPVLSGTVTGTYTLGGTPTFPSTVVTTTGTQTLTNKTLTTPKISSISNTGTLTLPTSTDTLVGRATTDTLTNKTLTSPVINTGTVGADPTTNLGIASKQYVDNLGTTTLVQNETPGGTINGSNTAFTTASTYATGSLKVFLNGQRLTVGSGNDYTETTQGFTMNFAPATGDVLLVDYNVTNTHFIQGSNSSIVQEVPSGTVNGSTTLFTVLQGKYVANTLEVYINGLLQSKTTDYTETSPGSGTFTFVTAPATGDDVRVAYQFSTGASGNADTVDGYHASATPTANNLLPLDSSSKIPSTVVNMPYVVKDIYIKFYTQPNQTGSAGTSYTYTASLPRAVAAGETVFITAAGARWGIPEYVSNTSTDFTFNLHCVIATSLMYSVWTAIYYKTN